MLKKALRFGKGFRVVRGNRASQAAEMVLPPGEAEGGAENRHRGADQWVFVVSGQGEARIDDVATSSRPERSFSSSAASGIR